MLTGGIDLSVGAVASMAAFLMATLVDGQGPVVAIVIALAAARARRAGQRASASACSRSTR